MVRSKKSAEMFEILSRAAKEEETKRQRRAARLGSWKHGQPPEPVGDEDLPRIVCEPDRPEPSPAPADGHPAAGEESREKASPVGAVPEREPVPAGAELAEPPGGKAAAGEPGRPEVFQEVPPPSRDDSPTPDSAPQEQVPDLSRLPADDDAAPKGLLERWRTKILGMGEPSPGPGAPEEAPAAVRRGFLAGLGRAVEVKVSTVLVGVLGGAVLVGMAFLLGRSEQRERPEALYLSQPGVLESLGYHPPADGEGPAAVRKVTASVGSPPGRVTAPPPVDPKKDDAAKDREKEVGTATEGSYTIRVLTTPYKMRGERLAERLRERGYTEVALIPEGSQWVITIGRYPSATEAEGILARLAREPKVVGLAPNGFPGARVISARRLLP